MNAPMPALQMEPQNWEIIRHILQKYVPDEEVWAFGSRAKGTAKPFSDLDLAIITSSPLPLNTTAVLNEALSESDLPWKVDIVDWSEISSTFQAIIAQNKIVVQSPEKEKSHGSTGT